MTEGFRQRFAGWQVFGPGGLLRCPVCGHGLGRQASTARTSIRADPRGDAEPTTLTGKTERCHHCRSYLEIAFHGLADAVVIPNNPATERKAA